MEATQVAVQAPAARVAERPAAAPRMEMPSELTRVVEQQESTQKVQAQQAARAFAERTTQPPTAVSTSYDPVMRSVVITTVSNETGQVVSQVPSKELISLAYRTQEFRASFVDMQA